MVGLLFFKVHYHPKWYGGNEPFVPTRWAYLLETGKVLTREKWDKCMLEAKQLAAQDLREKYAWRDNNPTSQGRQRPRLQGRDPHGYMWMLLTTPENGAKV